MEGEQQYEYLVFGIENPLLDISKEFSDDEILKKYNLQHGMASLATEEQKPLYDEIFNAEGRELIPGGSTLNTIRATNFMLKDTHPKKTVYFGCIGNDTVGETLEKELESTGVHGVFHKDRDTPTGTCAVIIINQERTLVANLAACLKYPTEHLKSNFHVLEKSKVLYTSAFFVTSNYESLMEVAKYAAEANKPIGFNLSACFLIEFNTKEVNSVIDYADFVFCNEDEAKKFGEVNKIEFSSLKDVATAIAKWNKVNTKRPRSVIITQGKEPIILATAEHKDGETTVEIQEIEIPLLTKEQIVDTNGAGDSFVGGFLSQIAQDKDLVSAIKAGTYLSQQVIQRSGCTFPEKNEFAL